MQSTANANGSPTPDPPARVPPGPRGLAWLGVVRDLALTDPLTLLDRSMRRYGDIARYRFGRTTQYFFARPEHIRHFLVDNAANYVRSPIFRAYGFVMGDGLIVSDGPVWRRHRRLIQPLLGRHRLEAHFPGIVAAVESVIDPWATLADGATVDMVAEMSRISLAAAGHVMFGVDLSAGADAIGESLLVALHYVARRQRAAIKLPERLPTPARRRAQRAVARLDEVIFGLIRERRGLGGTDAIDLLSVLMAARDDESGLGFTDREARDEVVTMVLAGYETTAMSLAWACHLLATHPDVARRLAEEADAVLGDRAPVAADMARLTYARMVFEETMRLYPVAWYIDRVALADDVIGGYPIPAGAIVCCSPYITHRHPDLWSDADAFDPERFSPARKAAQPRHAWFPFGAGPHACIGAQLAMIEGPLTLAMMARRYRLEAPPGLRIPLDPHITLRPRGGIPMHPRRR